jgi:Amt family ammonium transporter
MQSGDTAWLLVSAALVMVMTPGLALFYGGMVRQKNILTTLMHSFIVLGIVSIEWMLVGYSFSFGPDLGGLGIIGDLSWFGLGGVGFEASKFAPKVPHQAFMIYQMMFAVITPALISGAFAERFKFSTYVVFTLLWSLLVYNPVAHWVWGGGWLSDGRLRLLDFAGGSVVHITAGVSALAAAIVVGKRKGYGSDNMSPHNLPMTVLGAGILWFGWFGFNAGSALAADNLATSAFVATHMSAAAGTVSWVFFEWWHRGKPTMLGAASGCIAGLGTITPASGFVNPAGALAIGLAAGMLCYGAVMLKGRFGYDDSLDVVGVHGVGGIFGTVSVGIFATLSVNAGGANGLLAGNPALVATQAFGAVVVAVYSFAVTWGLMKGLDKVMGLRVTRENEIMGLDLDQHGEQAYNS